MTLVIWEPFIFIVNNTNIHTLHVENATCRPLARFIVPSLYKQEAYLVPAVHTVLVPHLHVPLAQLVAVGRLQAVDVPHLQVPASHVSERPLHVGLHCAKNENGNLNIDPFNVGAYCLAVLF